MAETIFVCSNCGNEFGKWAGQCSACKEWNSLREVKNINTKLKSLNSKRTDKIEAKNLGSAKQNIDKVENIFLSNIGEFDRVLGKGIVRGSVVLFGGEPGIGKSTLLTQLIGKVGGLYVAGEESADQIGMRVRRLGLLGDNIDVLETNSVEEIEEYLERTKNVYNIVVVDSIQTMLVGSTVTGSGNLGAFGSVNQIREATFRLVEMAKKKNMAFFIVGHVTKEGEIAGPKLLEHMVDTVLYFEGDKNSDFRILRVDKNRFGPTDEVGVFKMLETGLAEVSSSEINLVQNGEAKIGSAITVVMEGTRPMMVEVQALVTESFSQMPKRVFSGIDFNRGQLLVAVVQKVVGIPLYSHDVYVSVTGGIRLEDTGSDMAVVGAIYSSYKNKPLMLNPSGPVYTGPPPLDKGGLASKTGIVLVGEVSLLGEVKKVRGMEKREKEAKSMGREILEIKNISELKAKV